MIYNLQLLRALAALSVVYLHVASNAGLNLRIGVGNFGVDLFFVISGFTIAYAGRMPATIFIVRRCIRILPFYWCLTLGAFVVAWWAPTYIQSAQASLSGLLHSLLFLPFPNKFGLLQPTLALGWTLNYEMYFYMLFAVALIFTQRHTPLLTCVFIVVTSTIIRHAGTGDSAVLFYANPIVYEFVFGMLVYHIVDVISRYARSELPVAVPVILVITSLVAGLVLPLQEHFMVGERALLAGVPAAILVLSLVSLERRCHMAARSKFVVLLGDSSYVLYLIHPYVVYGVIRLFLDPAAMGRPALALAVVLLPLLAYVVAIVLHLAVERPLLLFLRARLTPKQPLRLPQPAL